MRVVGVIQARMGSTRFPGKMLATLAGRPLIWHVARRMQQAVTLDELVLATTSDARDNALALFASQIGLRVVRGSEDDVLARFMLAAERTKADVVVRINGDAPLVDPTLTDRLVSALIAADADTVGAPAGVSCFHDGVDPMSRRILDRLHAEAGDDPIAREHVSGYLKHHPDFGRACAVAIEPALQVKGPRLSIDMPDDLAFFENLYRHYAAVPGMLDLRAVAQDYARGMGPFANAREAS